MRIRRQLSVLLALCLVATVAPLAAQEEGKKGELRYTITVTDFENKAGYQAKFGNIGNAWATVLTDRLNRSGHFMALGQTEMRNEAMAEQDFAASDRAVQGAKTPQKGQMTPAQLLVRGAITHVQASTTGGGGGVSVGPVQVGASSDQAEINATMYIVDAETGQVVASTSVVGKSDRLSGNLGFADEDFAGNVNAFKKDNVGKAIQDAIKQGVEWMTEQLPDIPWTGSIAAVRGDQVYINRGAREGIEKGQVFTAGKRDVIRDPSTGEVLDVMVKDVATIEVTEVRDKLSICSVTSGDASALARGMTVKPK